MNLHAPIVTEQIPYISAELNDRYSSDQKKKRNDRYNILWTSNHGLAFRHFSSLLSFEKLLFTLICERSTK